MELWKIVLGIVLGLLLFFVIIPVTACTALTCTSCGLGTTACVLSAPPQ